jgi:hypothetical protein
MKETVQVQAKFALTAFLSEQNGNIKPHFFTGHTSRMNPDDGNQ